MQLVDPTAETEPDYESAVWDAARNAIIAGGKTPEEAIGILREGWRAQHDGALKEWNEHLQRQQEEENKRERGQADLSVGEQNTEPDVPEWINKPTPSFLDIKPARNILKRLEKKEFIELWYFTAEGCKETSAADLNTPDNLLGLLNTGTGFALHAMGAPTSSKVIQDEDLSWNQLTEAKTRLVGCMKACGVATSNLPFSNSFLLVT
ncbi:hypothetical protein BJ322DRAFT_1022596 [Thelephora terrestris]|uniref:Uncharacterized protein n=1 Tax=Thelephora terrestris TaxID=56493 RepID=A0A9P6L487_9AGAM|nr:hypothetical protein BJ322DRAFT_1022596 [Thelephora terrestris]